MGRIGCFLNGCCYGKPTNSCLGVHYPKGSAAANKFMDAALHPVQLYETFGNILLAVFLLLLLRRAKRGVTMASYMLLSGILRFSGEFFRGDHRLEQLWFGKFTPAQTVGLFLIPAGTLTLIYFLRKNGKQNNQTNDKQSK
jgi:phosphatidylglycerol:prolipoprotein diacylglycerol transferase